MNKIRKLPVIIGIMLFIIAAVAGCGGAAKEQPGTTAEPVNLTIAAAASLKDATEDIKAAYEKQHQNVTLTFNLASSGTLQKQIEEGAPADLFISAGKPQMDALEQKGLLIDDSRKDLLGNELVLIAGKDSELTGFEGLTGAGVGKISIGTPETVPAGQYAKEALTSMELWDQIQPKLVLAKDVRQVLTYVETGNVDAGLVYRSDAAVGKDIKVVASAPADSHKPVVYPVALIKDTKNQKDTEDFANYLFGDEAAKIFDKYGFTTLTK